MVWLGLLLIGALALLPLLAGLRRLRGTPSNMADERASALALYRGQLAELDRDLAGGLIDPTDYESARLEVQRRLLVADKLAEAKLNTSGRWRVGALIVALPVFAFILYIVNGHPSLPPQPHDLVAKRVDPRMAALFAKLNRQVATMTPDNPGYAQGHALLGQVEEASGQIDAALKDYRAALAVKFAPELALRIAELQSQRDGHISADSLALYRRALDAAPPNAPWRMAVEGRIATGEHDQAH
ncbi:c-type cytochrome biogenesis protein CcmI [Kozakia baliensis]|uniref:c-type cytochrome biogenesis protein CcmI n=1 Tax=Kozakia baliensis TaxID=153496 RepID=UPI00345BF075